MAEKELRHLKRSELVEIIYELKLNEQKLIEENKELKKRLEEREVSIRDVGSLAEASLVLSDIFKAAQESVDIYVNEIKRRYDKISCENNENNENNDPSDQAAAQSEGDSQ